MLPALQLILFGLFSFLGHCNLFIEKWYMSLNPPTPPQPPRVCASVLSVALFTVMGNVSSRKDEAGPSRTKDEEGEEHMDCAHGGAHVSYHAHGPFPESMVQSPPPSPRAYPSPLLFIPQMNQVPLNPLQRPDDDDDDIVSEMGIPMRITWSYEGNQVAVEGSWDNWKTRNFLQKSGKDFTIIKVLAPGAYRYRFIVDGQWRYSPDLPQEHDSLGNVFNVLDLQDSDPQVVDNISGCKAPSSPVSSYDNSSFSFEDFNEKLPELPPLLLQSPLDHQSSSLGKPLPAVLNHLYIQKGRTGQSLVALNSTHRFRKKYVTLVLFKPLKK